jgi:hypothetical protein
VDRFLNLTRADRGQQARSEDLLLFRFEELPAPLLDSFNDDVKAEHSCNLIACPPQQPLFSGTSSHHSGIMVGGFPGLHAGEHARWMLPHNFIRVNTIFEVGRANGLVTAYADKHPSHKFLSGALGVGLSQGYFPEVTSVDCTVEA